MIEIAIVGAGPSGFYAAEGLLASNVDLCVDIIDRLPTPFGLVRAGVAPDHQHTKQVIFAFDKIARHPRLRFLGNVVIGERITVNDLLDHYHAVVVAIGAGDDPRLGIPSESLDGSLTANQFVGWYNGHPDFATLPVDLSHASAVVVGHGNVAADICRILCLPVAILRRTDIAEHALQQLAESRIRTVHLVGRKGPLESRFTSPELKELGKIPGAAIRLTDNVPLWMPDNVSALAKRNAEVFRSFSSVPIDDARKTIEFRFFERPVGLHGSHRVESVQLARVSGSPGDIEPSVDLECGLFITSIGSRVRPLPGLPLDARARAIANDRSRVVFAGRPLPGLYVAGWAKRGPTGTIGVNRADGAEVKLAVSADLPILARRGVHGAHRFRELLACRDMRPTNYADWLAIDDAEIRRGLTIGRPREKIVSIKDMLACCIRP